MLQKVLLSDYDLRHNKKIQELELRHRSTQGDISLPKNADNRTENATSDSLFEKGSYERAAFARLCAMESSVEAASG